MILLSSFIRKERTQMISKKFFSMVSTMVLLTACANVQTTQSGAIGINRQQYIAIDPQQLNTQAAQTYVAESQKARAEGKLNANPAIYKRINDISQRLIAQTGVFRPDARNWKWQVNVLSLNELNAYCLPGGKIMVNTGLVDQIKATDSELAAVIGHEIAHALRDHAAERISVAQRNQTITGLGVALLGAQTGQDYSKVANFGTDVFFNLPNNREQESEADRMGLELMARAGYDPRAAVSLWKKMIAAGGNTGSAWLSTHPSGPQRIASLEADIPIVMPLYQGALNQKR